MSLLIGIHTDIMLQYGVKMACESFKRLATLCKSGLVLDPLKQEESDGYFFAH